MLAFLIIFSQFDVDLLRAEIFSVNPVFPSITPFKFPLTTTYNYDTVMSDFMGINYSDATPDLTFTYDRLGRQKTVNDALGSRTFVYNTALQPLTETITGLYNKTLTRIYATSGVIGRLSGFNTGSDYAATYGYDTHDSPTDSPKFHLQLQIFFTRIRTLSNNWIKK